MWYAILLFIVIIILFIVWITRQQQSTLNLRNPTSLPYSIECKYIPSPPKQMDDGSFKIDWSIPSPENTIILGTQLDVFVFDGRTPIYPNVFIKNITTNGFQVSFSSQGWSKGGVMFMMFSKTGQSQQDYEYIFDIGRLKVEDYPKDGDVVRIYFSNKFETIPKIITPYNGYFEIKEKSYIFVRTVTTEYFEFWVRGNQYSNRFHPKHDITFVAIEKKLNFTKQYPFPIEVGEMSPYSTILNVNGKSDVVFGVISFSKPFENSNVCVMTGSGGAYIDTITSSFFHINSLAKLYDGVYSFLKTIPYIAIGNNEDGMSLKYCETTTYISKDCPTIYTDPRACPSSTITYLPITTVKYAPMTTEITDELRLEDIVICNVYISPHTKKADSDRKEICNWTTASLSNEDAYTEWIINCDYGYFSNCSSFGNVLIRINSSYPSKKEVKFKFTGLGDSKNFQYYIQWGTGLDQIHGPYTANSTSSFTFGTKGCGPFNVLCKVEDFVKGNCPYIVKTLLEEGPTIGSSICDEIWEQFLPTCITIAGGPEDVIGDGICSIQSYLLKKGCVELINSGTDIEGIGYDSASRTICNYALN